MEVLAKHKQSIMDITAENFGRLDDLVSVMKDNNVSINEKLVSNTEITVNNENKGVKDVKDFVIENSISFNNDAVITLESESENENSERPIDKKFELNIDPVFFNKFTASNLTKNHETQQAISGLGSLRLTNDTNQGTGAAYIDAFEYFVEGEGYDLTFDYNILVGTPVTTTILIGGVFFLWPGIFGTLSGSGTKSLTIASLGPVDPANVLDEDDVSHPIAGLINFNFGTGNANYDIIIDNILVTKL